MGRLSAQQVLPDTVDEVTPDSAGTPTANEDVDNLGRMSDEALNLISVGAHALMGGQPDTGWGAHTDARIQEDEKFAAGCGACRAAQWFDAAQAEMRRRGTAL